MISDEEVVNRDISNESVQVHLQQMQHLTVPVGGTDDVDDGEGDGYIPFDSENDEEDVPSVNTSSLKQEVVTLLRNNSTDIHTKNMKETEKWDLLMPPPWLDDNNRRNDDRNSNIHPLTFLHNEIVSFVQLIEPLPSEVEQRETLIQQIKTIVQQTFPDGTTVEIFGSQETGLFLPTSDIDLVILSPKFVTKLQDHMDHSNIMTNNNIDLSKVNNLVTKEALEGINEDEDFNIFTTKSALKIFAQAVRKEWGGGGLNNEKENELSYLEVLEHTRIPLVKFTHAPTNISVDVSFDQISGPPAAKLMKQYLVALPPLRPLTFVLKYYLVARALNEPYTGGVGSFLLQLMIVAFLQHRERYMYNCISNEQRSTIQKDSNLGSLLLEFLELYGIELNYFTTGISVRYDGFFFPKGSEDRKSIFWKPDRMSMLAMENPLEPTLDVGQSSFRYQTVQRSFAVTYKMLLAYITARPDEPQLLRVPSILATILPPTAYMASRKVLKKRDQPLSSKRIPGTIASSSPPKRQKYK